MRFPGVSETGTNFFIKLFNQRCDVFQDFIQMFRSDLPKHLPGPYKEETEGTRLSSAVRILLIGLGMKKQFECAGP